MGDLKRGLAPSVACRQGGVFTADQARTEGWTDRTVRRRISSAQWVYVAGRGLALPTPRWTPFQLGMAARLTLPDSVVSHWTAAGIWGFPEPDLPAEQACEVILRTRRSTGGRAIRAHLIRLDPDEVRERAGLLLTSPMRTGLDCLASASFGSALDLWAWLSTRKILDARALEAAIAHRRDWHGTPQLRRLRDLTSGGAVSQAEFRCHELLRLSGLTGWTANLPITDDAGLIGIADIAFPVERVLIEIDGFRAHSSRTAFITDRRRQNRLIAAGYLVLRFTWDDLQSQPQTVIRTIRRALSRSVWSPDLTQKVGQIR